MDSCKIINLKHLNNNCNKIYKELWEDKGKKLIQQNHI